MSRATPENVRGTGADVFEARRPEPLRPAATPATRVEGSRAELAALRDVVRANMSEHAGHLRQLSREAVETLSKQDFAVVDTSDLFPEGFGERLHAALRGHAGVSGRAILDVGKNKYRVPPKVRSEVEDVLGSLFAWAGGIVHQVAARDYAPIVPDVGFTMQELRALPVGLNHDPEAERWHRDGSTYTVSIALSGPGTEIAPDAEYLGGKIYRVDEARILKPRLGEMVIMSGGARKAPFQGTVHRAPASSEPRLVLIAFASASSPAEQTKREAFARSEPFSSRIRPAV